MACLDRRRLRLDPSRLRSGPGFMGHWMTLLASPGLGFFISNMGIFLPSQPLGLVRKTPSLRTEPRVPDLTWLMDLLQNKMGH